MSGRKDTRTRRAQKQSGRKVPVVDGPRDRRLWSVTAGILAVGAIVIIIIVFATRAPVPSSPPEAAASTAITAEARQRQSLYEANCASCHGARGQGYAQRGVPAPALDRTEHAWHHSDEQILALMSRGGSIMPAVGADWSYSDLTSVLAYVKLWWTPEQRRSQQGTIGE